MGKTDIDAAKLLILDEAGKPMGPKTGFASTLPNQKIAFFCHCVRLAPLWLAPKIGGASTMPNQKIAFLFAIVFGLHHFGWGPR